MAPERTRVVVTAPGRSRAGIVRVRDRRAIGVAARPVAEPLVVVSATSSESSAEPAMLFVPAAPAVVEIQAP